jgi:N-acyl-D-aspartate/D-glutamate deacylase
MSKWTLAGATIVDGTGAEPFQGNLVIEGDRIASAGTSERVGTVIDSTGLVAVPGFVDIHSHLDWIAPLPDGPSLLAANVQQGITTSIAGNCGISPAPLGEFTNRDAIDRMLLANLVSSELGWNWRTLREYLTELERRGLPLNLATFVGHSTLRATVLGGAQRPATVTELDHMRRLLEDGLRDGAVGLSVGLEYFPGRYAGSSEVEELARTAAAHDGLVAVHTRGISELFDEAMDEAVGFARSSRCRLQIAHVNPMGKANWDGIDRLFDKVDAARSDGIDIAFDIVGYTAWTMTAIEALPHVVADLGTDAVLAMAATVDGREHLRGLVERAWPAWPPWVEGRVTRNVLLEMGWDAIHLADETRGFTGDRGKNIVDLANMRSASPWEVYFDILTESKGSARIINDGYGGNAADDGPLRRLVARPDAIPETDTVIVPSNGKLTVPLPMFWGTMPRFLGRFSRDLELIPMPQAVQRITQLPARRARLIGRGELAPNSYADVVLLDWDSVSDAGTFLDPEPASGIEWVFVNGEPVVRERVYDPGSLPGRAIRSRENAG